MSTVVSGSRAARWASAPALAVAAACVLLLGTFLSGEASGASRWDAPDQGTVLSRAVLVAPLVSVYVDDSSLVEGVDARAVVADELERFLALDPRFDEGTRSLEDALEEASRSGALLEQERLVERYLELGRQLFRAGDVIGAARELDNGLRLAESTTLRWRRPAALADAWEVLALALLERASAEPARQDVHEAAARHALRELIRTEPGRVLDERFYPPRFVDEYRRAFFEQVYGTAVYLSLRNAEARLLTSLLPDDVLLDVRVMRSVRGSQLSIRVWDRVTGRFVHDALLAWDGDERSLRDAVSRALGAAAACLPPRRPAPPERVDGERGRTWVYLGWAGWVPLVRPTREPFLVQGLSLGGQYMITETVGMRLGGRVMFSARDRDGELLAPMQALALDVGPTFQWRRGRLRVWLDVGVEFGRHSEVVASRDFWCRVSGGALRRYDEVRACEESDLTRQPASFVFGVGMRGGAAVQVGGPLWAYLTVGTTLLVAPLDARALDRPLGGESGLLYRF